MRAKLVFTNEFREEYPTHFFATSAYDWRTSEDVADLLEQMTSLGTDFHLFMVPLPANATYDIRAFQPMVDGARYLGKYTVPKGPNK